MSTQSQVLKFGATILQNLPEVPEDTMQNWIENPKQLQKLLAGLNPPINGSATEFKVWKTLKLGTGIKDADGFREAIKNADMRLGDWASDIMSRPAFTVASEPQEVDLVVVSVEELGFKRGATREKIYQRALERGLQLCPKEVGPQLRLDYKDQPMGEWLIIGMEPIAASDGRLKLFYVAHFDRGRWLHSYYGGPDGHWDAGCLFVFVPPRK